MKNLLSSFLFVCFFSILVTGCSKDEIDSITVKSDAISVLVGSKIDLGATSGSKITYTSDNPYYATVSDAGIVTGGRVGSTNITLKNSTVSKIVKVTTISTNFLYPDPLLAFGASQSEMVAKLGTPTVQNTTGIMYNNSANTTDGTLYLFTNDKLTQVTVFVKTSFSSLLSSYLTDRFAYAGQMSGSYIYFNDIVSSKITIGVSCTLQSNDWYVIYTPYTSTN